MNIDDLRSLHYFWETKGDITCWISWDRSKADLRKDNPEVFGAWEKYLESRRALSAALRDAISNSEED